MKWSQIWHTVTVCSWVERQIRTSEKYTWIFFPVKTQRFDSYCKCLWFSVRDGGMYLRCEWNVFLLLVTGGKNMLEPWQAVQQQQLQQRWQLQHWGWEQETGCQGRWWCQELLYQYKASLSTINYTLRLEILTVVFPNVLDVTWVSCRTL